MISFDLFRERLRSTRESHGLTIKALGEQVGISGATISRYETGVHEPKSQAIALLSEALGVSAVWLMGGDVDKYKVKETENEYHTNIPVLGVIAAGQPMLAQENIIGYEYSSDCDFCLKVKGDSMIGARIFDGDTVYIHSQPDVENGEIAAVIIDGENAI